MEHLFKSFCAFGGGPKDASPTMDGAKFSKFCRDMKILDKRLSSTDVDIIFAKAKQKTERKIDFNQFMDAFRMIAEKKYPGDPNCRKVLERRVLEGSGPSTTGTTRVSKLDGVERMTDTSLYTGTHKERFDESGKGRGMEGQSLNPKGKGPHSPLVSSDPGYVFGYKNEGSYKGGSFSSARGSSRGSPRGSPKGSPRGSKVDVVDRLTDTSKYTGAHKYRFDESGQGKGMAGRDLPSKGAGMSPGSVASQQAYVSGYKNEGSYGKK